MFRVNNMELIKNYIFSLCGASIIISVAKIILHKSRLTKTVNIFLSLFLLFYMIAPFKSSSDNLDFYESENIKYTEDYLNGYSEFINISVKKVCDEENCLAEKISVYEKEKDGENVIDFIEIKLNDETKAAAVAEKLKNDYGFEVNVS